MRVYLDDIREAPEGWTRARTAEEAIALLETGEVEEISLDHDLGEGMSGYDVATWMEMQVALSGFIPPKVKVHWANPVGRDNIMAAVRAMELSLGDRIEELRMC